MRAQTDSHCAADAAQLGYSCIRTNALTSTDTNWIQSFNSDFSPTFLASTPVYGMNNAMVASSWTNFVAGTLIGDLVSTGGLPNSYFWSGAVGGGAARCVFGGQTWYSFSGSDEGVIGLTTNTGSSLWNAGMGTCISYYRLMCLCVESPITPAPTAAP
jgi:hypothetical protein